MKISLALVKQFTKVDLPLDQLMAKVGSQLGAIEEVTDLRGKYEGIKVVQITKARPHPNADKLNIYRINDGSDQFQVISGDKSLVVGDKAAWLAPGVTVPSSYGTIAPMVMEARALRGEMSYGMLGSGKELDLNDDHEGVLKLDTDKLPGTPLSQAYDLDDVILDIENKMFTHRPDCFGLLGVAREIAGIQELPFHSPEWYLCEAGRLLQPDASTPLPLTVDNQIPALCPVYRAVVMDNVTVMPSPLVLQSYLKRVGIRPINNVVDVTNWMMYMTAQPLHAFDYDKVCQVSKTAVPHIVVRTPKGEETLQLLDGSVITPHKEAILICANDTPIALGGVMGGRTTEVDEHTRRIIIEAANFNMYAIRKTAMEHGIFTDAVTRFGKGQSSQQCGPVLVRTVELMQENAGARVAMELGIEAPSSGDPVKVRASFVNQRLGADLAISDMIRLLQNVEMKISQQKDELRVVPPFWRTDIEIPEDIVEEVGRLYGYDRLPQSLPLMETHAVERASIEEFRDMLRRILFEAGNNELQTYSFVSSKLLLRAGQDIKAAYRIRNALSPELEVYRTSLLPSLLDKVHNNHKAGYEQFGLFEIGKSNNRFDLITQPGSPNDGLPYEHMSLGYVFSSVKTDRAKAGSPYYQAKYELAYLLERLYFNHVSFDPLIEADTTADWWLANAAKPYEAKRAAVVRVSGVTVGVVGEIKEEVKAAFKLPDYAAGFELELGRLHGIAPRTSAYRPLLRFPAIEQDISFKVAHDLPYSSLARLIIQQVALDERIKLELGPVDIFERPGDTKAKHITYRLRLQHHDKTMTTKEVNRLLDTIAAVACVEYGAERI